MSIVSPIQDERNLYISYCRFHHGNDLPTSGVRAPWAKPTGTKVGHGNLGTDFRGILIEIHFHSFIGYFFGAECTN